MSMCENFLTKLTWKSMEQVLVGALGAVVKKWHMIFILKLWNLSLSVEVLVQIQDVNPRI